MNVAEQNPYWLSLKTFLFRYSTTNLLDYKLNEFPDDTKEASLLQAVVKQFAKIEDNSELMLRTTTEILSGSITTLRVEPLDKFRNFPCEILHSLCFVRRGKSGKGWPLSSNMELETKFIAKSFVLTDEDEIISGTFMIADTDAVPQLRIL